MKYVNQVTRLMHFIIKGLFPEGGNLAYDMTLGRGKDSDFLSGIFKKVISLDIQEEAVKGYKAPRNVEVLLRDHTDLLGLSEDADLIVYNLGYLPGSKSDIITTPDTTLKSVKGALGLLKKGGLMMTAVYTGHDGGKERDALLNFLKSLDDNKYSVLGHNFLTRPGDPPELYVTEKRG